MLGVTELLSRQVETVGVFRPVVREGGGRDQLVETVRSRFKLACAYADCVGMTYEQVRAAPEEATAEIVARYRRLAGRCDAMVVVGTDHTDVGAPTEFGFNATLAAHLGTPVLLVVSGMDRTPAETGSAVAMSRSRNCRTRTPA